MHISEAHLTHLKHADNTQTVELGCENQCDGYGTDDVTNSNEHVYETISVAFHGVTDERNGGNPTGKKLLLIVYITSCCVTLVVEQNQIETRMKAFRES